MRFIGGKRIILTKILEIIKSHNGQIKSVSDLFSGSGVVSKGLKSQGYSVVSNDILFFSYVLLRGTLPINQKPKFSKLTNIINDPIDFLNLLDSDSDLDFSVNHFIYENYSPISGRLYFSESNALKIDRIRSIIEFWKDNDLLTEDEFFYLLATLIEATPFVSNTTGTYGAYLKHWDPRALKPIVLKEPALIHNNQPMIIYNDDAKKVAAEIIVDLAYYDPPYNARQYLPNYHILETIARWDSPIISGKTGLRPYEHEKSNFCIKSKVFYEMEEMIRNTNANQILLSYNTEGLLHEEEICEILLKYGNKKTLDVMKIQYPRYKSSKTKSDNGLKELLFYIQL